MAGRACRYSLCGRCAPVHRTHVRGYIFIGPSHEWHLRGSSVSMHAPLHFGLTEPGKLPSHFLPKSHLLPKIPGYFRNGKFDERTAISFRLRELVVGSERTFASRSKPRVTRQLRSDGAVASLVVSRAPFALIAATSRIHNAGPTAHDRPAASHVRRLGFPQHLSFTSETFSWNADNATGAV